MRTFAYEGTGAIPTVQPSDVDNCISVVSFHRPPAADGTPSTTTICSIVMDNGHVVTGASGCVVAARFNAEIGEVIALEKAKDELWALLGYELRLKLLES